MNDQHAHTACPYLILGIRSDADKNEVEHAYRRLITIFDENNFVQPQAWVQSQQVCLSIENAYKRVLNGDDDGSGCSASNNETIHPKTGQMLVAGGFITIEQLQLALQEQTKTKERIGQILLKQGVITQAQLDNILFSQRLLTINPLDPHHLGQRLVSLGLITEDMLNIVILDKKSKADLGQSLIARGWLAQEILDCLAERMVLST